jgi:RimJ/RimL family protein N-acetyltransferase
MDMASGVAVQRLSALHRAEIERHLLRLSAEDRRLRFGRTMRDEAIQQYAAGIEFARDRVFGIHAPDLELVGVAHLALAPDRETAELGLSVDHSCRGRGYGRALLQRAVMHAANLGYRALFMHCLAENRVMMHLAVKAGLKVVIEAGEANARLALDRRAHGGAMREAIEDQFALVDYVLKQQWSWLARPALTPAQSAPAARSATPR